jgi:hypothetical protein
VKDLLMTPAIIPGAHKAVGAIGGAGIAKVHDGPFKVKESEGLSSS